MTVYTKGGQQHAAKKHVHAELVPLWQRPEEPLDLNSQEFRFSAIRPGKRAVSMDEVIESVTWRTEGNPLEPNTTPQMTGSVSWREIHPELGTPIQIPAGTVIRCELKWFGRWTPLWEMRIQGGGDPELSGSPMGTSVTDGVTTADLRDDLSLVSLGEGVFHYKKGKTHPNGWRYDQIVRDVCSRFKIPITSLPRGILRIKDLGGDGSLEHVPPMTVLLAAVGKEVEWTGERLIMSWAPNRNGRWGLKIEPPRHNPFLYRFEYDIRQATVSPTYQAVMATSLVAEGSARGKKGKHHRFKPVRVGDRKAQQQFGFIERRFDAGHVDSRRDLTIAAKRELLKSLKPVRVVSDFNHFGVATIRKGDAIFLNWPQYGFVGENGFMFVVSAEHTLSAGDYTMTLELFWRDPLDPEQIRKEREAAAKLRKRSRSKHHKKK